MLDLSNFRHAKFLCFLIWFAFIQNTQETSVSPTFSTIANSAFSVGTKAIVADTSSRTVGFTTYTATYVQQITNPGLVLSLNKFSALLSNSAGTSGSKYFLANPLNISSTGFSTKIQVFSSGTTIYSTILQYMAYNKVDSLIQSLQVSNLYMPLVTNYFYYGENYHEETVALPQVMVAPPRPRFYLPSSPTCIVYTLGHKIDTLGLPLSVSANCSAEFGTNQALVTVYASDNSVVDTYLFSVFVYVQPEGRYFGYFEDSLKYAYGTNSVNRSQQYLWVSANNYDPRSTSQYSANIAQYIPGIVSLYSSSLKLMSGVTAIAVADISQKFEFSFSSTLGTFTLSNAESSTESLLHPWIVGTNKAHVMILGIISCQTGYYYDKVTATCYSSFSGGDKSCTGPQYHDNLISTGAVLVQMERGVVYSTNGTVSQLRALQYDGTNIVTKQKTDQAWGTSTKPLILSQEYLICQGILFYRDSVIISAVTVLTEPTNQTNAANTSTNSSSNNSTNSTLNITQNNNSNITNSTTLIYASTLVELIDTTNDVANQFALQNYQYDAAYLNLSNYQSLTDPHLQSIQMLISFNSDFALTLGIIMAIDSPSNTSNSTNSTTNATSNATYAGYQPALAQVGQFAHIGQQILTYIQTTTGTNLTAVDVIQEMTQQQSTLSDRIVLRVLHARTSFSSLGGQAYEYTTSHQLQLILDNYVFGLGLQGTYTFYMGASPNSPNLIQFLNSDTHVTYLLVSSQQCTITYTQALTLPVSTVYDGVYNKSETPLENFVVQVVANQINYQQVPSFINMSQYNYLQAYYTNQYYQNRRLFLSYLLSSGVVYTYASLNPYLNSYYNIDLNATNSTINYTYTFDYCSKTIYAANLTSTYIGQASSNVYNNLYSNQPTFNYAQVVVDTMMANVTSSLISGIGDEGHGGLDNGTSADSPDGLNIEILLDFSKSSVADMVTTFNGEYLFVLTNTNLLYLLKRQQLHSISPATLESTLSNLTNFYSMKLLRLIDLYPELESTIANVSTQSSVALMLDETNGVIMVGTDAGNLYTIDCGWGVVVTPEQGGLANRDYLYEFVQLDIPAPPIPPVPNNTNETNTTNSTNETNTTNGTISNSTDNNTINSTNTTNDSNVTPTPQPVPKTSSPTTTKSGLSQTTVIIISVVCSVLGVASAVAIYFLFIKAGNTVKVNPELATKTNLYNTKSQFADATQIGEKVDTRTERINSGKTDAGSLMEFQYSSGNSVVNVNLKKAKVKKTKDLAPQNSLQTLRSLDSPYADGNGRGLVQDKDRTIIIDYQE